MRTLTALLLLGLFALPAQAQEANPAQIIAPLVDDLTVMIFRFDLSRLDVETVMERLKDLGLPREVDLAQVKPLLIQWLATFAKAGGKELFLVGRAVPGEVPCFVVPLAPGADTEALKKLAMETLSGASCEIHGKLFLAGEGRGVASLKAVKPVERPEIGKAFAATGDSVVQGVLVLSATLRRAMQENLPQILPRELGGGNLRELLEGFSWAAVRVSLTPKLSAHYIVQAKDAAAAKGLKELADNGLLFVGQDKEAKNSLPDIEKLAALLSPTVQGDRLTVEVDGKVLASLLLPAVQKVRLAAARTQSMKNLHQLALAMHNYHDTYKTFPPFASHDKQGKPLLSWRVHVLPYLEQEELYKQFRLDEPWDSAHNKKLIPRMPKVFHSPLQKQEDPGQTFFLVPVGKDTIFSGPEGMKIQEIPDGTSNTIMILEANDDSAVIWTKPVDFPAGAKDALERILRPKAEGFLAAYADGSVRMFERTIPLATLRAMFTRNGGEVINLP